MTPSEWQNCTDPAPLLDWLRRNGKLTDRKARLFAVACCRSAWPLLTDQRSRRAVEVAERHADGLANDEELAVAFAAGYSVAIGELADYAAAHAAEPDALTAAGLAASFAARDRMDERAVQATLLRCIAGSPFEAVPVIETEKIPKILAQAQTIYERRSFDRLPTLADALAKAGCDNPEFLSHLRDPGPHARGCWAVDLILGKA